MFRPSDNNLYVIPDIHGNIRMLEKIFEAILPLKNSDKIVFLGDYIDRHTASYRVIESLIAIKKQYPQCIFLKGNHEFMMLAAAGLISKSQDSQEGNFRMWMANGGRETVEGYLSLKKSLRSLDLIRRTDIKSLISKEHLSFMLDALPLYEEDEWVFVHGGLNPERLSDIRKDPLNYEEAMVWDRSLIKRVEDSIKMKIHLPWRECIVTGHNGSTIMIHDSFMMLDCGSPRELLVAEMRSKECLHVKPKLMTGKDNWGSEIEYEVEEYPLIPSVFKEGKVKRLS